MKKAILAFILTMAVASQILADEIDEARELLAKERGGDILFLSKINLGISGGDNWIANRNDGRTYTYTINDDKEVRIVTSIQYLEQSEVSYFEYDIMKDIPGTRLGNKVASFGDYNGDDKDEIFNFYDSYKFCSIWGYDSEKEEEVSYFAYRYDTISSMKHTPVMFTNYHGKSSILVHLLDYLAEQYIWVLLVWNEENRKYEKLMEIDADKIDWSLFTNDNSQIDGEPVATESVISVAENKQPEAEEEFSDDDGKNSRFIFYIGIAVGVTALALAVFFVVRRKKG
jgi:hypothetical protein